MPIELVKHVTKADIRGSRHKWFVFGDNVARSGYGGMAKICRDEPNCIGVATKWYPSWFSDAFFYDSELLAISKILRLDFLRVIEKLEAGEIVVIPILIGTGRAEMPTKAPKAYQLLTESIQALCTKYGATQAENDENDTLF